MSPQDQIAAPPSGTGTDIPLVVQVLAEEDDSPLGGVTLTVEPGGGDPQTTNEDGIWTFYGLPSDDYTLTATLAGYYGQVVDVAKLAEVDRVDFTIRLAEVPPPPDPKPLIEAVLEKYRKGYEDMDLEAVEEAFPEISARASAGLARLFESSEAIEYVFGLPVEYTSLDEIVGSARVKVAIEQTRVPRAGPEQKREFEVEFGMTRRGDEYSEDWFIAERLTR